MKVLHAACLNSAVKNIGVVKQMAWESEAAKKLGLTWDVEIWASDEIADYNIVKTFPSNAKSRLARRYFYHRHINNISKYYDIIILRYSPLDIFKAFLPSQFNYYSAHHTKEVPALSGQVPGLLGKSYSALEVILGYFCLLKPIGYIAVTDDILQYERSRTFKKSMNCIVYPNGIGTQETPVLADNRSGKIKVVFLASTFFAWNGLSKLLDSFSNAARSEDFELHLIGNLLEDDKESISKSNSSSVFVHSNIDQGEIELILSQADVGLAAFNLKSAGLEEACTLKVREYLSYGIPVFSGHKDSAIPDGHNFYKIGNADIDDIYRFGKSMRKYSRDAVHRSSKEFIDKEILLKKLYFDIKTFMGL